MDPSQPPQPEAQVPTAAESTCVGESEAQITGPSPAERLRAARARRRQVFRQVLVIGFCFFSLLCFGGVASGFLFYHQATKPDLSTPEHVTRKYLEAYLVDRDEYAARQYQCSDTSGLSDLRSFRDDIDSRGRTNHVTIAVSLDSVRETSRSGGQATVSVDIVLSTVAEGDQLTRVQHWEFAARDQDGWHVCSGHQVAS